MDSSANDIGRHFRDRPQPTDLCDLCGAVVPVREQTVLRVQDSSAVTMDTRFDGHRLLRTCGEGHMSRLAAVYRARPFVQEELWAGQITRAVSVLGPLPETEKYDMVVALTGLDEDQIMRAVAWQDSHGQPSGDAGHS
ncbi:hypothetical protein OHV05_37910 (plasmid) [Kitasatospora sp. NBC_00070]|uniref:hypothetical protein n=1 Tax=Kitasatospora sp. NBC_00070 TaxID=2975962 RepID=UPI002F90AEB9